MHKHTTNIRDNIYINNNFSIHIGHVPWHLLDK